MRSMIDTLIVVNPDGTIKAINQTTLDLLGYEREELIGKPLGTILAVKDTLEADMLWEEPNNIVGKTYLSKGGSQISVLFSSLVMKDEDDKVICIICTGREINDHKRGIAAST